MDQLRHKLQVVKSVSAGTDDEHALLVDACWCVPVHLLLHRSFLDVGR
jgi:hypothetical protein